MQIASPPPSVFCICILFSVFLRSAASASRDTTSPRYRQIMDLIRAEMLEAGSRIAPLRNLDEIAAFFLAAAAIGQTAPSRATAPSLNGLVAASLTPPQCLQASFQRCLPCRTWKGFFRCSRLARICPSVPIAIPVPCASMACSNLQNTTPRRRCSPPKVDWSADPSRAQRVVVGEGDSHSSESPRNDSSSSAYHTECKMNVGTETLHTK